MAGNFRIAFLLEDVGITPSVLRCQPEPFLFSGDA